jgi:hypothetical protein
MKMLEPDYWKGKGRYSKQALSRKIKDEIPFQPRDLASESAEDK